jgi:crotonobetainyl-CoA:carnitine CoA-transferase CaiB-like acyl-CoA transferase
LSGVTVVDLTRVLAGPYCTMLLADLGADVIKVEPPEGDVARTSGPFREDDELRSYGGYFQSTNRNKRSIAVDLRTPDGANLLRRLASTADVLVENFRPGVMDKLGLSYESLSELNPKLVYGAIRGFGDPRTGDNPYLDRPAFDVVAQAMGGLMSINGHADGPPTKVGPGIGDLFPAALTAVGVLAAVIEARTTGQGRFVDVSMYDSVVSLCERIVHQYSFTGRVPGRDGNDHPLLAPFGVFRARDGWVAIGAPLDKQWAQLCNFMGRPELAADPDYATNAARVIHRDEVRAVVEGWTITRTRSGIVSELGDTVPVGPVNAADDLARDPYLALRGMLVDLEQPGSAESVTVAGQAIKVLGFTEEPFTRAPLLGEHTDEVIAGLGYTAADISDLRDAGAVR